MAISRRWRENPLLPLFRQYARPHRKYLYVSWLTNVLGKFPEHLPPLLIGIAIDSLFLGDEPYRLPLVPQDWLPGSEMGLFFLTLGLIGAAMPVKAGIGYVGSLANGTFNNRLTHDVRTDVFDTVQRLEMGFFDDEETGDVMSILNNDVQQLPRFAGTLSMVIHFVTFGSVAYLYLLWLNWQLATVLVALPVVLFALSYGFSAVIEPRHMAVREKVGALNNRLNNNLEGISVIKSFGTERHERDRVETASMDYYDASWDVHVAQSGVHPILEIVQRGVVGLTLLVGGYWVIVGPPLFFTGTLTAGALFTFYYYMGRFITPMQSLVRAVDAYQNAKAAAKRVEGAIQHEGISAPDDPVPLEDAEGRVEYENVSFSYPERESRTLDEVSLDVEPGETVGIVGPTGAGKSTLCKLLLRFYDPTDGTVRVDGIDVRELALYDLRESIGYVSQEPFLFHGTVRENVAYAQPDLDAETVRAATELSGAHEFVEDLPEGYDTMVGERGVKLSGGQRQRLAIARAIVRDPQILILDEATSHVDNETEALVKRALDTIAADRTTFAIAHRLSTVRDADRIYVFDRGRIVERGTHEELLERDGLYADLWAVQVGEVGELPESFLERVHRREGEETA